MENKEANKKINLIEKSPKKKIKVGLFIDTFFPMVDGVVKVVENYAKLLNDNEFEAVVFAPRPRDKKYVDDFPFRVHRCKSMKVFFLDYDLPLPKMDKKFKKMVEEEHLDIVHAHSPFTVGEYGLKFAKKHKIPSIITFHSQFKYDFKRAVKWKVIVNMLVKHVAKVFNLADVCFTMNEFSKNLIQEYGCTRPIEIVPNGTDFESNKSEEEYRKLADKTWNLQNEKFVMLYLGRINKLKNLEFIFDMLSILPKDMEYKMIFAGGGGDKSYFEKLTQKLGLEDKVLFTGKILDKDLVRALYAREDLFLIPSTYDTDAIVKIEASYFEKPSICLENTGAGSSITNDKNGFLIKEDKEEFKNLVVELYSDRKRLERVGKNAKIDLYKSWEEIIKVVKENYKRILSRNV